MASNKWDKIKEAYESAEHFLADMPIAKAIGGVIANPTPQEVGAQISNLGQDVSKGLQEFTNRVYSDPAEAGSLVSPIGAMVAFHGGPYKFDKFSLNKIGTGEGAQAYGHGLYFAGSPETAQHYQFVTGSSNPNLSGKVYDIVKQFDGDEIKAKEYIKQAIKYNTKSGDMGSVKFWETALSEFDELKKVPGNLYKVDIPEESEMLDWDAPLSEQPKAIQDALKDINIGKINYDGFDMGGGSRLRDNRSGKIKPGSTAPWILESSSGMKFDLSQADADRMLADAGVNAKGENIYSRLTAKMGSQAKASEYLNSLGIKGIKYFDAGSRAAKEGSRNYVIFNDKDITILERNAEKFLEE